MKITRVELRYNPEKDENELVKEEAISLDDALLLPNDALLRVEDSDLEFSYITHAARPYKGLVSARQFKERIENLNFGKPIPDVSISDFWNSLPDKERSPQVRHKFNDGKGGAYAVQMQRFGGIAQGKFQVSINNIDVGFVSPLIKLGTLIERFVSGNKQ